MRLPFELLALCLVSIPHVSAIPQLLKRDAPFESVRTHMNRDHSEAEPDKPEKYFHESTFHKHYDGRFADRQLYYDEKRIHLVSLLHTYLSTMNDIGIETFIVHGTLLGWWWNRKVLPWDDDLDVMVSERSIYHLAEFYNMTMHHYKLPGIEHGRDYLLEVNPNYSNSSEDGANKIDARWIDTDTGLYIDITTLRRNETAEAENLDGAMMVKDKHHYMYDEIFPLRSTTFEDIPVKIPYAYSDLLVEEYGTKALTNIYFHNHKFDEEKGEWVALGCRDFKTCRMYRNALDAISHPAKATQQGDDPLYEDRRPALSRAQWTAGDRNKPLPPRLLDGRPWQDSRTSESEI